MCCKDCRGSWAADSTACQPGRLGWTEAWAASQGSTATLAGALHLGGQHSVGAHAGALAIVAALCAVEALPVSLR